MINHTEEFDALCEENLTLQTHLDDFENRAALTYVSEASLNQLLTSNLQ